MSNQEQYEELCNKADKYEQLLADVRKSGEAIRRKVMFIDADESDYCKGEYNALLYCYNLLQEVVTNE